MMTRSQPKPNDGGAAMFLALGYLGALTILSAAFFSAVNHRISRQFDDEARTEAFYIAEAGLHLSLAALAADPDYKGQPPSPFADGRLSITILKTDAQKTYQLLTTGWPSTDPRDDRYIQLSATVRIEANAPRLLALEKVRRSHIDKSAFLLPAASEQIPEQ